MGRVYTAKIKRISKEVFESFPDAFSNDYEKNKEFLKEILDVKSKKILNQIAGYITRIKNSGREEETSAPAKEGDSTDDST